MALERPQQSRGAAESGGDMQRAPLPVLLVLLLTPCVAVAAQASPPDKIEIREGGLVASLWLPEAAEPAPGILLLGGSGGGIGWQDHVGERLASQGFAALALGYFGLEGLPDELERIPLEYIQHGLTFLRLQPRVDRQRLGVVGVSKGGELALLLASKHPEVRAVVAFVPSGLVWQSVASGFPDSSSWSYHGDEVPYVPYGSVEQPRGIIDFYRAGIEQATPEALAAATIPVEEINGPILLLSGRDDNLWPSTDLSERVVARLSERGFSHPVEHRAYENAGHLISRVRDDDVSRRGGTDEGNRKAQLDARGRMMAFLREHLIPGEVPEREADGAP